MWLLNAATMGLPAAEDTVAGWVDVSRSATGVTTPNPTAARANNTTSDRATGVPQHIMGTSIGVCTDNPASCARTRPVQGRRSSAVWVVQAAAVSMAGPGWPPCWHL